MLCRSADHSLSTSTTNVKRAQHCLMSRQVLRALCPQFVSLNYRKVLTKYLILKGK